MKRIKQVITDMSPAGNGPANDSVRLSEVDERRKECLVDKLIAGERSGFVAGFDRDGFIKDLRDKRAAWVLNQ